jgi:hypothetical protein
LRSLSIEWVCVCFWMQSQNCREMSKMTFHFNEAQSIRRKDQANIFIIKYRGR